MKSNSRSLIPTAVRPRGVTVTTRKELFPAGDAYDARSVRRLRIRAIVHHGETSPLAVTVAHSGPLLPDGPGLAGTSTRLGFRHSRHGECRLELR